MSQSAAYVQPEKYPNIRLDPIFRKSDNIIPIEPYLAKILIGGIHFHEKKKYIKKKSTDLQSSSLQLLLGERDLLGHLIIGLVGRRLQHSPLIEAVVGLVSQVGVLG